MDGTSESRIGTSNHISHAVHEVYADRTLPTSRMPGERTTAFVEFDDPFRMLSQPTQQPHARRRGEGVGVSANGIHQTPGPDAHGTDPRRAPHTEVGVVAAGGSATRGDHRVPAGTLGNAPMADNTPNHGLGGQLGDGTTPPATFGPKTAGVERLMVADIRQQFGGRRENLFNEVDVNHDGRMSFDELGDAVENHRFHGKDAQAIAALYQNKNDVAGLSLDEIINTGVSRADLDQLDRLVDAPQRSSQQNTLLGRMQGTIERTAYSEDVLNKNEGRLFDGPFGVNPSAINQGTIGDCYFEAAVASVAQSNPQGIRDMIHDNHNGTYTVTFPGDRTHPVTVQGPTAAEMGLFQGASFEGVWPNVLEKAFGEYRQQQRWFDTGHTSSEGGDGGGYERDTIRLLTGSSVRSEDCFFTSIEQQRRSLTAAIREGRAVTVSRSTRLAEAPFVGDTTRDGFVTNHVYSIIGFDAHGPGGGTVTVRNPWGTGGQDGLGTSRISLEMLRRNFNDVSIEKSV